MLREVDGRVGESRTLSGRDVSAVKIGAITMAVNEHVFLPIWLNHYGREFGCENLFIIDDGSDDGSIFDPRVKNLFKKRRSPLDEDDRAKLVSCFHEELLGFYDVVIYADIDELIAVDPRLGVSLSEYLATADFEHKNVVGLNVLHHVAREKAIELSRPLFEQRSFVEFEQGYCKPLISKIPLRWTPGFHACQRRPSYDGNLLLFHLRAMDIAVAEERARTLNSISLSASALRQAHADQYRVPPREYVKLYFSTSESEFAGATEDLQAIVDRLDQGHWVDRTVLRVPERFRGSIRLNDGSDDNLGASSSRRSIDEGMAAELFSRSFLKMMAENPNRGRNELCPCGSGQRFKHCHGALGA